MKKKINTNNLIFIISFFILAFQNIITQKIYIFKYYDEVLCLVIFFRAILIITNYNIKVNKNVFYILTCTICFTIIGIVGNFLYNIQETKYVLIDLFSCIRVFLLYVGLKFLKLDIPNLKKHMILIAKILTFIIFIFGIINIVKDIGMSYDVRYGLRSYSFIYSNPGTLVIILVTLIAILDLDYEKNKKYILIGIISVILTLRGLGIAIAGIYVILKVALYRNLKISKKMWVSIIIISVLLGYSQIKTYFIGNNITPRKILISSSINIANDYFPTGAGFGTFGSDVTKDSYSKLYYEYGISSIYGLSKDNPALLTDNYFPMILAQCGWIGLIIVFIILYFLYKDIKLKSNKINNVGLYLIYIYILISSIAAQILSHYLGVLVILMLFFITQVEAENNID